MKRLRILWLGGLVVFVLAGCFSKSAPVDTPTVVTPRGMTPVETVQFYFEQWNNRNAVARGSVVREEMRGGIPSSLVYVRLDVCVDKTEEYMDRERARYPRTYPGYIEYAVVDVEFEIEHRFRSWFDDAGGFPEGKVYVDNVHYTLGKTSDDSDWVIVDWGFL